MHERLELACVQMTLDTRLGIVAASQLSATSGAEPANTRTMLHADVHPTFHRVQFNSLNKPGLGQPENPGIQVRVLHWCPPGRTLAVSYPRKTWENLQIYTALTVYLLMAYQKFLSKIGLSGQQLFELIYLNLFGKDSLEGILNP